ncbi:signal peptidase I [Flavobacterium sp.]|uniref:signal peptidase I n=1 Tax=Flavobacterium sp. TaxID=239 RepID=UPI0037526110
MNKKLKTTLLIFGILFISYSIIAQTGILKAYKNSTISNEPNMKINSRFFVSNLVSPKIGDFICYKRKDTIFGNQIRVHKLCGMENDVIEIKNGVVYLNGINIDKDFEHMHSYQITKQEYENIKLKENISKENIVFMIDENNLRTNLEDLIANKYGLTSKKIVDEKGKFDKWITETFKHNWNKDNFGPLKIPEGKVFVMGDNRDNSEDSRYTGFLNKSEIVGVVVGN